MTEPKPTYKIDKDMKQELDEKRHNRAMLGVPDPNPTELSEPEYLGVIRFASPTAIFNCRAKERTEELLKESDETQD